MHDDLRRVYEVLLQAQAAGDPVTLATVVATQGSMPRHSGSKMLVQADGSIIGTIGGGAMEARVIAEALAAISDGRTRLKTYTLNNLEDGDPGVCGGTAQIFIEPINSMPTLLVIGGGHTGKALAELGKWSGYRVLLSDDRPAFCNADYAPNLDGYLVCKPSEIPQRTRIDQQTYIACVTRGISVDLELIPALLQTAAAYIGLIGSQRRWALTAKALKEQSGLTDADLSRIFAPIGLELQAETPKEIAVSILAQIIMLRRGGSGQPMTQETRVQAK